VPVVKWVFSVIPAGQPASLPEVPMSSLRQLTLVSAVALLMGGAAILFAPFTATNGYAEDPKDVSDQADGPRPARSRPAAPAASEFAKERDAMVTRQIERPWDGRTRVKDKAVLAAMRAVPRHAFVPARSRKSAHADSPLPIGHGQTISQPYIVALMTELLELKPEAKVLEIGTGSGYQAAVLAHLTPNVSTVEIIEALAARAKRTLKEQGYTEVKCSWGDGYFGWEEEAPFDGIIVTCAAGHLPPSLWKQLEPGGAIVIPIGGPYEVQRLVKITKTPEGKRLSKTIIPVRFVPLTRESDADKRDRARRSEAP
jgi:protein-L-isoaspartate(D-aspartate) O-methyltransferase